MHIAYWADGGRVGTRSCKDVQWPRMRKANGLSDAGRGGVRDGAWCGGERRGLRETVHVVSLPASPWPDDLMHRPGGCQRQRCTKPSTIACRCSANHDCPCSLLPSPGLRLALSRILFCTASGPKIYLLFSRIGLSGLSCAIVYLLQPHWQWSRGHRVA